MTTINSINSGLSGQTGTGSYVGSNSPTLVTPALGTPSSGNLSNCTGVPSPTTLNLTTQSYSTGTIAQSGTTITGTGTTFTSSMVGGLVTYPSDHTTIVASFVDATTLLAVDSLTEADGVYTLQYNGVTAVKSGSIAYSKQLISTINSGSVPALTQQENLNGGTLLITGSNGTQTDTIGGDVVIKGGYGTGTASSGSVSLSAGDSDGVTGNASVLGTGITIGGGAGGQTVIYSGTAGVLVSGGASGAVRLQTASAAHVSLAADSGNLYVENLTAGGDKLLNIDGTTHKVSENDLGTGVLTALGVNVGSAGAPVVNGGALGTPSSGTLSSCSGLSLTSGVSGVLPVANGGTNASSAGITAFNNITGYTAAGATGTTSTNLVFSTSPAITTPSITGVSNGSTAGAGIVGQLISGVVAIGDAVALTDSTAKTIVSISLTAGDWDVWGNIGFIAAAGTLATELTGSISLTDNTQATSPNGGAYFDSNVAFPASVSQVFPTGTTVINVASTTTVYLVATAAFSVSTMTAYGYIGARRVR